MLDIDATFLIVVILVWILVLALSRLFFKPVGRIMRERDERIRKDRAATQETLDTYEKNLERIEERLKEAKAAADALRQTLEAEAVQDKSRLLRDLSAEYRQQIDKAKEELNAQVDRLKKDLDREAERLAQDVEKRLLN
ncbi:MAG TPA: hypothetical protein PLX50_05735 [Candidatus Aminicenantes bacterium]|nr:hypothetical protein [Candidatus Aminicenantes bacterium]